MWQLNIGESFNFEFLLTASNQKELQGNFATPRRALGDVNKIVHTGQTPLTKPVFLGEQNPEKESSKKKSRRALAIISENELVSFLLFLCCYFVFELVLPLLSFIRNFQKTVDSKYFCFMLCRNQILKQRKALRNQ